MPFPPKNYQIFFDSSRNQATGKWVCPVCKLEYSGNAWVGHKRGCALHHLGGLAFVYHYTALEISVLGAGGRSELSPPGLYRKWLQHKFGAGRAWIFCLLNFIWNKFCPIF